MIDYEKVLGLCTELNISVEEHFLLYTIYLRTLDEYTYEEMDRKINVYYNNIPKENSINYVSVVNRLQKRGLLKSKVRYDNSYKNIKISDLTLTEKGIQSLFYDEDEVWKKFISLYPAKGISPQGTEFFSNIINEGDEERFKRKILKGKTKFEADRILFIVDDLFDGGKKYAKYGIKRFIISWDTILKNYEKGIRDGDSLYSGYTTIG